MNNIKAFNGFIVNGLDSDTAGTREVQLYVRIMILLRTILTAHQVIKNIWTDCVELAKCLNLAWTGTNNFSDDRIEETKEETDSDDSSKKTMTFLMRNEMDKPSNNNFDVSSMHTSTYSSNVSETNNFSSGTSATTWNSLAGVSRFVDSCLFHSVLT